MKKLNHENINKKLIFDKQFHSKENYQRQRGPLYNHKRINPSG